MPKKAYLIKVDHARGQEDSGAKNYGGIYPYAYMDKDEAIRKAHALTNNDIENHGGPVREFELIDVNIGDKAFAKLVAAKDANPNADVPLFLIRIAAACGASENIKLYGGVYPWAYADVNAAYDKQEALEESGGYRTLIVAQLNGVAGLKSFITKPAPAPAPTPACGSGCSCRPRVETVTGVLRGSTASGATVTGVFAGTVEGGE